MNEPLVCDGCGQERADVHVDIDPFVADVYGEEVEVAYCEDCFKIASDDV